MRLNLQQIMHVPGASIPFAFQLDLSQEAVSYTHLTLPTKRIV